MERRQATGALPPRNDLLRGALLDRVIRGDAPMLEPGVPLDGDAVRPQAGGLDVLRLLVAFGSASGALIMVGVAIWLGDRVPLEWVYVGIAVYVGSAIALTAGSSLPEWLIRFLCFDLVVIVLAMIVAIGNSLGYLGLIYALWPALTVGLFGSRTDFVRLGLLFPIAFGVALAFSDIPVPALAWAVLMIVVFVSAIVIRAIAYRARTLLADLDRMANTDALTGLLNRRAATEALDQAVARAHRQETELAIVVFDLDHFKRINDTLGHPAGDQALRRFAEVLSETCASTDVAARLGGEEFVVLLLRSDESGARTFAERFQDALEFATAHDPAPLSVSGGVACLSEDFATSEQLLIAADRALYAAKRAGRRRVVAASDPGVHPLGSPLP